MRLKIYKVNTMTLNIKIVTTIEIFDIPQSKNTFRIHQFENTLLIQK